MVLLTFSIKVKAPREDVWKYFCEFENIQEWDPNVKSSKVGIVKAERLGTTYELVTIFNEKESDITYTLIEFHELHRIVLRGRNSMVTAEDNISFRSIENGTEINYEAEISLNHIFCCCTCLIRKDLEELARLTEKGMTKKCRELFGENSC